MPFRINHSTYNVYTDPSWLNYHFLLDGMNGTDNSQSVPNITARWVLPTDPYAYFKQQGTIYSLTRDNGSRVLLTDVDVTLRLYIGIYVYDRADNNTIVGYERGCFDFNNDNDL